MAKAKATPEPEPEQVVALVPSEQHPLVKKDDKGRPFIEIPFELRPEGGEFNTDVRLTLPRMRVLQTNSAELKKETRVEGAEAGMFYNNADNALYESFEGVPLYLFQERYYNIPKMSGNMVCTSRDGRGEHGTILRGDFDSHNIPHKFVRDDQGRETEVGLCSRCPHSSRGVGGQAECVHSKILVMVSYDFVKAWGEFLPRIENGDIDGEVISDIINSMFTLGFRSTNMRAIGQIADQGSRDLSYFRWSWVFKTTPMSNDFGQWDMITVRMNNKLKPDEMTFARSLYKLAQLIRPVVTDVEVIEEPVVPETVVGDL